MPHPLLDRHAQVVILIRSRTLRLQACEVMEHATRLHAQAARLLSTLPRPSIHRDAAPAVAKTASPVPGPEPEDAEALHWYRAQVRQMLAAGWSRAELAEVGVTDGLLRELGLEWGAAG